MDAVEDHAGVGGQQESVAGLLELLVHQHYASVLKLSFLLTHDRASAEDIAQETFARSAENVANIDPQSAGPYLRKAAVNVWRRTLWRRRLETRILSAVTPGRDVTYQPDMAGREALWSTVIRLPARQRACLVMRYYEDLSEADTARILGCSIGTVKKSVSRALTRLRQEVSQLEEDAT